MTIIIWLSAGLAAYLLGAIPNGLLIARARGVDIRTVGSGNIGATNVFRGVSKPLGVLTFFCDALKGFVPAYVFPLLAVHYAPDVGSEYLGVACAACSVAGHNWPVYLKFKGGKGVATTAGALLGIAPMAMGVGVAVWVVATFSTRYVSVGSILAAVAVPIAAWVVYREDGVVLPVTLTVIGAVIVWRHRANIQRLKSGTENRF